jgi:glyoxylase-like metal-dependent hydrolase (beta-lactamase superfamily II)
MALEKIIANIYGLRMAYVNAFLIVDDEVTLIDSGTPNRTKTILSALGRAGRQPSDLKHIPITHHHVDHTGSLAALVEATGAKTYVHPADAPVVSGEAPMPGPNPGSLLGHVVGPIISRVGPKLQPAKIDQEINDGDELPVAGGLKVLHTPGHTAGHVSYLMADHGGVLFAGDAAANLLRVGLPIGMYTEDMAQARESFRKLAELEFDVACFGHGRVLKGQANVAFRRRVERLAR